MIKTLKLWTQLIMPWCNYWQLNWIQYVALAVSLWQASQSALAGREAEGLTKAEKEMNKLETEEAIRRKKAEKRATLGLTRAKTLASGVELGKGGTADIYLKQMMKEYKSDIEWIRIAGAQRAKVITTEGTLAKTQARADVASGLSIALQQWHNA